MTQKKDSNHQPLITGEKNDPALTPLFTPIKLKNLVIKNRVVMPPVVCFGWQEDNGFVTERRIRHYEARAKGGTGMIIVEATCVKKDGRITDSQLGIWSDDFIDGLSQIPKACKKHGTAVLIQLHHSGLAVPVNISPTAPGPSAVPNDNRTRTLTLPEIHDIQAAFISAAQRAKTAGFDGIELHGAHGFLINQFAAIAFNKREDDFGGTLEGRLKFPADIIKAIRQNLGNDFIIGYRLGSNSPTLEDGIAIAKYLELCGIDLLHASHGGGTGIIPTIPANFDYNWIVYSGTTIKKHVKIPVIAVNEIKTPQRASYLIEHNMADFTAIGKDLLTDPEWARKAANNEKINYCLQCKPKYKRYENPGLCPVK